MVQFINEIWKPIRENPNTIFWIIKGRTNKFINQDIVQTTNEEIQL